MPSIFLSATRRLVREHDLVVLVEGSAYMDTWTSALLWYFLWATHCAAVKGTPCRLRRGRRPASTRNQRLVRAMGERPISSSPARGGCRAPARFGVTAPIEWTADNAFNFEPRPEDRGVGHALAQDRRPPWASRRRLLPLAVVIRAMGAVEDRYRWPYYFSTSRNAARERELARDTRASRMRSSAGPVRRAPLHGGAGRADRPDVHREMVNRIGRVFSPRARCVAHDGAPAGLGALVTSRYHASVLSLAAAVPQLAVGHDLRLRTSTRSWGSTQYFSSARTCSNG
jgi:hypothetical protein